ncbi:DNRLRE domain-containing protein [Streptomyces sp. NPDC056738]|uniref:DNRLRE domain-containing protein n=1 Tax=Streptomyces sp. NPDC056738 TaxID=3345933 RepID=UPI003680F74F
MARLQDRKIEVLSARTSKSTTYALPSGALQTESYGGPIRVKRDGHWKDIDTSLSDTGDALEPNAAAADIAVSDGGDTQLASVGKGEESFGLGWQDKLPTPSVKDGTASYNLGDGQKLSVTALAQGFSEDIKLSQQLDDSTPTYRIPLNLDGLKLSQADSGHLLLKNADGDLVAEAPAPMMWDDSKDPDSGESAHQQRVDTKIETSEDGAQTLVLSPDKDFLATATYPVTIDPTSTLAVTTDTWVQNPDYPDSQVSSPELKSGTYDAGTDVARSYLKFDVSPFKGKHIIDTNLALYSYYSSTCSTSGAGTQVRRITSSWDSSSITWGSQPSTTTTGAITNTAALGYDSSCPAGTMNFDIDAIVQAWADGSANYGLQVRGASETDSLTWRRFRSANYISGDNSVEPHLTVTYNSYAATASQAIAPSVVNAYNGKRYVTSLTPTLSAKATDADGGTVKAQFEVTPDPAYNDTTYTYTATSAGVASGSTATLAVPSANAFSAGSHLRFRVRGYDSTDYGSWTGYTTFVLNTGLPAAPTISCPSYPQDTWSAKAPGAVTCTLDTTSTDGQAFKWGLDDPSMAKSVYDTVDGTGGDPLTISITPADGWHTLYAQTIDSGGNLSATNTKYSFGVGADGAALLSPGDGDRPARRVALAATGKPTYTGVTYQYRRGEADTPWHNVPLADVTKNSDGSAVTAWPLAAPNGAPPALTWNITTSLSEDGPVDIRVAFTDGTTTGYSPISTVTVDRNAGTAPSDEVGPGSVNDLTGDYTLSATDASAFDMNVSRTASSRKPTAGADAQGQVAIFGPQWTSGITPEITDSDYAYLRQTSSTSVAVVDVDGDETGFTATNGGGWKSEPGSEDLTLTGSLTGSFTLKDTQGMTTTFAKVDPAATTWQVSTTYLPTDNSTTKVVSEKSSPSSTLARPKYVIAPTSAVSSSTCETTPSTKGCRVLEYVYATSTTATSSVFADYNGQVKQIKLWTTDPGAASATATVIAQYAYDDSGRLRESWDPRTSPALKSAYTYDSAGRVATLTPPGELPWTFTYGTAGNAATAGPGMLLAASRPTLAAGSKTQTDGGTATTSMVYDVPLTGSNAPYSMGATGVAAWGQTDIPSDVTAVFPADAVPASHDGSALTSTSYTRASISYADASGREVNSATPGGHLTTTEYDHFGNAVRELTAGNRELALATSGAGQSEQILLGISGLSAADRAQQLSTTHVYSSDGQRELESFGPLHTTTLTGALHAGTGGTDLPAGSEVAARQHTVTAYDEGRPTDGTATVTNQPTTVTVGAYVDGYPSDGDTRTTKTAYDWAKGLATSTTDDPGGLNLVKKTTYDAQGRVIKTTLPKSNGNDAGAKVTTYYSATGTGACNGRPEWADLVCSVGPAGDITLGGTNPTQLPTKTTEYGRWGSIAKLTETANGVTRTTTLTIDEAGRPTQSAITGGVGTGVATDTFTYDPATGKIATQAADGQTIAYSYDTLGRPLTYNDGAGNTTSAAYDTLDRLTKTTDSAPSTVTYTYNAAGQRDTQTHSSAGAFTGTYDADGQLTKEVLPGNYTLNLTTDPVGEQTSKEYTAQDGTIVLSDHATYTIHGQQAGHTITDGTSTDTAFTYDHDGRLTAGSDTATGGCLTRSYTLDANSNRTGQTASADDCDPATNDAQTTSASHTYDSADRLTDSGYAYDAFGRTTTNGTQTFTYYANDLAHSETSGTNRTEWTLDAAQRLATATSKTQGTDGAWSTTNSTTSHYGCDCDTPTWSKTATGSVTRTAIDLTGGLAASTVDGGAAVLQLSNLHGDNIVQLPLGSPGTASVQHYDEFGVPVDGATTGYGWLGKYLRSGDGLGNATLMGVRLYTPSTGRFLSTDPIYGGTPNAYTYAADPVMSYDLDGNSIACARGWYGTRCQHHYNTSWIWYKTYWKNSSWHPSLYSQMPKLLRQAFIYFMDAATLGAFSVTGSAWQQRYHHKKYYKWYNDHKYYKDVYTGYWEERGRFEYSVYFIGDYVFTTSWRDGNELYN